MLARVQLRSRVSVSVGKGANAALLSHRQRLSKPFVRLMSTGEWICEAFRVIGRVGLNIFHSGWKDCCTEPGS